MVKMEFTPFPILTTERLTLRRMDMNDINEFFILKSDNRLLEYYYAKPKTYEEARLKLRQIDEEIVNNESIQWGVMIKKEDKLIGTICFWNISPMFSKTEIGYELMIDMQGRGIMQEALKAVTKYGFKEMKLDLIETLPNSQHLKSVKLPEKSGFIRARVFSSFEYFPFFSGE